LHAIDAHISVRRQGTSGAVSDAQIANKLPPKSYGASETMNTGPIGAANEERRSLVRFDLSAIPSLPHVVTNIEAASVSLARGHVGVTGPGTIQVHRVTAPWDEADVTWQSFGGAFDPAVEAAFDNGSSSYVVGVEALVSGWANGLAVYSSWTGEPNGPCDHTTPDTGEGTCNKWWQVGAAGHRGGYATTTGYAVVR
jgi:hypothetical protein